MWRRMIIAALLAENAQALSPAPIRWGGLSARRVVSLSTSKTFMSRDPVPSHSLIIGDPLDEKLPNRIPYFTTKPDNTIAWDAMGWCLEASGVGIGEEARVSQCTGGPTQRWNWHPSGQIQLQDTNKCLDVTDKSNGFIGAPIELQDCVHDATSSWEFDDLISTHDAPQRANHVLSLRHVMMIFVITMSIGTLGLSIWLRRLKHLSKKESLSEELMWESGGASVQELPAPMMMAGKGRGMRSAGPMMKKKTDFLDEWQDEEEQMQKEQAPINMNIEFEEMRVLLDVPGEPDEPMGVMSKMKAVKEARKRDVDLVLVNGSIDPPICKLVNWDKYRYNKAKTKKDNKKASGNAGQMKKLKLSYKIGKGDFTHRQSQAEKFLKQGNSVKFEMIFKGREITFTQEGEQMMLKMADSLTGSGTIEGRPRLTGRSMFMNILPKTGHGQS